MVGVGGCSPPSPSSRMGHKERVTAALLVSPTAGSRLSMRLIPSVGGDRECSSPSLRLSELPWPQSCGWDSMQSCVSETPSMQSGGN